MHRYVGAFTQTYVRAYMQPYIHTCIHACMPTFLHIHQFETLLLYLWCAKPFAEFDCEKQCDRLVRRCSQKRRESLQFTALRSHHCFMCNGRSRDYGQRSHNEYRPKASSKGDGWITQQALWYREVQTKSRFIDTYWVQHSCAKYLEQAQETSCAYSKRW